MRAPVQRMSFLVIVPSEILTKSCGSHQREHNAVARPVALEYFAFDQGFAGVGTELFLDLFFGLAEGQSFRLREEIGKKNTVVLGDGVQTRRRRDEVSRDQLGTLVNKLVE